MNNFVCIKFIKQYNKVTYYSVVLDGDETCPSLFEMFVRSHEEHKEKLNHVLSWLQVIGKEYGARSHLFRHEKGAVALPPQGIEREPSYIEGNSTKRNDLRLYCHRLNNNVVILFNGDLKTRNKAQDCPKVAPHFKLANKLVEKIDGALRNGDIEWDDEYTDILYEQNLKIEF